MGPDTPTNPPRERSSRQELSLKHGNVRNGMSGARPGSRRKRETDDGAGAALGAVGGDRKPPQAEPPGPENDGIGPANGLQLAHHPARPWRPRKRTERPAGGGRGPPLAADARRDAYRVGALQPPGGPGHVPRHAAVLPPPVGAGPRRPLGAPEARGCASAEHRLAGAWLGRAAASAPVEPPARRGHSQPHGGLGRGAKRLHRIPVPARRDGTHHAP